MNWIAVTNGGCASTLELIYGSRIKYIIGIGCCVVCRTSNIAQIFISSMTLMFVFVFVFAISTGRYWLFRLLKCSDFISYRSLFLTHNHANCSIPSTGSQTYSIWKISCGSRANTSIHLKTFFWHQKWVSLSFVSFESRTATASEQANGERKSEWVSEWTSNFFIRKKVSMLPCGWLAGCSKVHTEDCAHNYVFEYHYDDYYLYWNFEL